MKTSILFANVVSSSPLLSRPLLRRGGDETAASQGEETCTQQRGREGRTSHTRHTTRARHTHQPVYTTLDDSSTSEPTSLVCVLRLPSSSLSRAMSHSRSSFYPLPPSVYPQPLVDPCAAFETSYGHSHCAHSVRDAEHFRSRTLNPASSARQQQFSSTNGDIAHAAQGIYPRHGTGQFVAPYYRRDSKGFRKPYEQPVHVDEFYSATKDLSGLATSGLNWSHPSSRPTYSASRSGSAAGAGATFTTSYRNSGLFDATSTHTSRVTHQVGQHLQQTRAQTAALQQGGAAVVAGRRFQSGPAQQQSVEHEFGYGTGEVADAPPSGADAYPNGYESNLSATQQATSRPITGDILLSDPIENAYRKPRTVYKRAYGKCQ